MASSMKIEGMGLENTQDRAKFSPRMGWLARLFGMAAVCCLAVGVVGVVGGCSVEAGLEARNVDPKNHKDNSVGSNTETEDAVVRQLCDKIRGCVERVTNGVERATNGADGLHHKGAEIDGHSYYISEPRIGFFDSVIEVPLDSSMTNTLRRYTARFWRGLCRRAINTVGGTTNKKFQRRDNNWDDFVKKFDPAEGYAYLIGSSEDGTYLRIGRQTGSSRASGILRDLVRKHLFLAGRNYKGVLYAGEMKVFVNEGGRRIIVFDNASGTYRPSGRLDVRVPIKQLMDAAFKRSGGFEMDSISVCNNFGDSNGLDAACKFLRPQSSE